MTEVTMCQLYEKLESLEKHMASLGPYNGPKKVDGAKEKIENLIREQKKIRRIDIVKVTGISSSAISQSVTELENEGKISRTSSKGDKRVIVYVWNEENKANEIDDKDLALLKIIRDNPNVSKMDIFSKSKMEDKKDFLKRVEKMEILGYISSLEEEGAIFYITTEDGLKTL